VPRSFKDLIELMMKYEEEDRIGWEELFNHKIFNPLYTTPLVPKNIDQPKKKKI
jgi:hypothetical protein